MNKSEQSSKQSHEIDLMP